MDIKEHTTPEKLDYYAFLWSLARMVIAAFSLFFGALPIVISIFGYGSGASLLPLFWLISGVAAVYLGYRWYQRGQLVFGGKEQKDTVAFLIMVITGVNLGLVSLISTNVGMGLVGNMPLGDILFKLTAVVYLVVAWYLWKRWKENNQSLFQRSAAATLSTGAPEVPAHPGQK